MTYTEANYENAILDIFSSTLGYTQIYGPDITRDYGSPLYVDELRSSLHRINRGNPNVAIEKAIQEVENIENDTLLHKNKRFMHYLQNGISINYFADGEDRSALVHLIDYQNVENNYFTVANQWTIVENSERRPDIVVFVNGLPIVVFELKSPSREETDASAGYRQLRNYMHEIPSLFIYNAFMAMSDLSVSKAGTITANEERFMKWKTVDGNYENTHLARFEVFVEGMFQKDRLLDIIKNFICFSEDVKILAAYHQYFAVRKAVYSTKNATISDGKGGVFWHTQGSGKSLSMVFYAQLLQETLNAPTIVVLTDRNDLDEQLFKQFVKCKDFLRQTAVQADSREHLKKLLAGRVANGIIFTTMQKFEESHEPLSDRRNIIVMADEAHRGQYGLEEKVRMVKSKGGEIEAKVVVGTARIIRDSLPNATYIGFTGTPISSKDRSTTEIFGNYIDIYDMTQAVEDEATKPVYYESRVIHLKLDEDILKLIDTEYDLMAQSTDDYLIEKSKKELGKMESILGAEETLSALCEDILDHYENNRQYELTGKAMIVAYSRTIAMKIYEKLLSMRPDWADKVAIVMTENNNDPESWRNVIGNKRRREELAKKFKDDNDPMKIAIVVDMWLTGFDVPSLATMYIYKPMKGHNLMQAIARVNRVYEEKEGGLAVDYVGIASALKQAMNDYTKRDKSNYGDMDIAKTALVKFREKLEVCRDLFYGYDYSEFMSENATDRTRARLISGGADFISQIEAAPIYSIKDYIKDNDDYITADRAAETKALYGANPYENIESGNSRKYDDFIKEALLLRQALSLCRSLLNPKERFEAAYFDAVRTMLTRFTDGKKLSLKEINGRINELLKASIQSKGVINLFSDVDTEFSLFDPKFLAEIANMKERNLALEILKKLLAEQVSIYKKTNLVKSEKFSERLAACMKAYINGMISNEEVIAEMMKMAQDIAKAHEEGNELGLTNEELAFYDALTRPQAIKDIFENDALVEMTRELTEMLRKSRTIDWQKKESARAGMRRMVKKLLKKYKYPPEGLEDAIAMVIGQCEMWADSGE